MYHQVFKSGFKIQIRKSDNVKTGSVSEDVRGVNGFFTQKGVTSL